MYQRTVLPNGIRIISEYLPYLHSVTLGAWFEVGSRHETATEWGLSHFIEHMMFKGTEKYSAREIAELMDNNGGYLNAFTSKEHTCYYFKVLAEHFSLAAEILQQMLLHSSFSPREIAKEQNVVLEELSMYEDSPEELIHDLFPMILWPDHSLGRSILGSSATINSFNQTMITDYLKTHYTADRLVIVSVGNITHEQVVEEFAGAFEQLPAKPSVLSQNAPTRHRVDSMFQVKDTEQIHLCLGGPALSRMDEDKYALHLLDTILGGGISSLLFQELREERGLVYSTYSFNSFFSDTGYYGVYAAFNPQHWNEVWDILYQQFTALPELITVDALNRAKSQLRGSMLLSLESTSNKMSRLAAGEFDEGRIITPEEIWAKIAAVEYNDLMAVAAEIYNPKEWSWVGLGPKGAIKEDMLCRKIC